MKRIWIFDILFQGLNPRRRPVVIVDIKACIRPIYRGLEIICGGQGKLYQERWTIFIKAFESAGIDLWFVNSKNAGQMSAGCRKKRQMWAKKRCNSMKDYIYPIFDRLVKLVIFCPDSKSYPKKVIQI